MSRRSPVLRGARWGVGTGAALALLGVASSAVAAPEHVRLSYTGPSDSSMTVAWNTSADVGTEVRYGTTSGNYTDTVPGSSFQATGALGYVHEVELGGLQADTTYFYQAGDPGDGYSPEYHFTTGPAPDESCGQFRFVYLGDNRPDPILGGGQNYDTVLAQAMSHDPAFVANGGDLVADGEEIGEWVDYLGYNDPETAFVPNMPCLGNHDTGPGSGDSANYNQIFALPRSQGTYGSGTEDYYYFTYGNAIFVALSTESFKGGAAPFADQAAWLDEVLTNNPRRWKFVYYHKPTYAHEVVFSVSHEPNEEGQNGELVPIFDKHHVDMVFTSHNHWYERYAPSACANQGNPGSSDPCPVADPSLGTVYFVSGGAGAFTIPGGLCTFPFSGDNVVCSGSHHYMVLDIDDETLTLETWGASPQANVVIDSLTITKPVVDCEPLPPDGGTGGTGVGGSGTGASGGMGTGGVGANAGGTSAGGDPGAGANSAAPTDEDGSCGCRLPGSSSTGQPANALWALAGVLALAGLRRRRH